MLKTRLGDTNKVVQGLALDIVARIATGMNKPFEKYSRILVLPVAQVMADQKTNIRAAGGNTLTAIASSCEGIDSMTHFLGTALASPNPLLRTTLLGWMTGWFKENEASSTTDLSSWATPLVSCLEDRSADVRKGAQAVLPIVIAHVGVDQVLEKTNALKPASRSAVVPLIQAAAKAAPSSQPSLASAPVSALPTKPSTPQPAEPAAPAAAPQRKGLLARRLGAPSTPRPASRADADDERPSSPGGPLGTVKKSFGMKRPVSTISKPPTPAPAAGDTFPFIGTSQDPKRARLAKDAGRWIIESGPSRKDLAEVLQHQMEPYASRELVALLFSHDHNAINDHIAGLNMICDCYNSTAAGEESYGLSSEDAQATLIANADFPLKFVSTKVHEPQPNLINKCLDVVDSVLALLGIAGYLLTDAEAACFVPTMIHKARSPL